MTSTLLRFSALASILLAASLAHADDGGALRVLVRGDVDGTAVAAQIAAELGIATSLVDSEDDCVAPCAMVSVDVDGHASIQMLESGGGILARSIDLPAGPGAAEVVALVVGNLARDEAAMILAGMGPAGTPAPAPAVTPAPDAPVIIPPSGAPRARRGAPTPRPSVAPAAPPRDPEAAATFSFGLIPPLAIGVSGPRGGGGVAVDLVIGGHRNLHAFSVSGVGSVVTERVIGTQIGGAFAVAGRVEGGQIGGAISAAGSVQGAQIAGALATASGNVDGAQLGGAVAIAGGTVRGAQISGAVSIAREVRGAQLGGAVTISAGMASTQLAGAVALAGGNTDTQIAGSAAVTGGTVRGVQISPFNVARRVEGVQIGVVNIAGGGDGVSIGLLNLVRGGRTELEATLDDRKLGALVLRHGSRRFHNVYGIAARADESLFDEQVADDDVWMYGLGLGPSWRNGRTTIDVEAMGWHVVYGDDFTDNLDLLAQLRLVVGHPVGPAYLVVGGAINTYVTTDEHRPSAFSPRLIAPEMSTADDVRVEVWPSVFVGARL